MSDSEQPKVNPERAHKTLTAIWFAMVASIFVYGFVGESVIGKQGQMEGIDPQESVTLIAVFVFVALINGLLSLVMPGIIERSARKNMKRGDDPKKFDNAVYFAPQVVGMALAESVALFGFVLLSVTQQKPFFYGLLAMSLILFLLKRPKPYTP